MGEVIYNRENDTYYQRRKIDNQTIELGMNCTNWSDRPNKIWFNVYITIFNKRKDMWDNMDKKIITGKNPFKTFAAAREMFYEVESYILQQELVEGEADEVIIFCTWVDNRRRDAYYKVLHKMGYDWGVLYDGVKCIMKTYTLEDINPDILNEE